MVIDFLDKLLQVTGNTKENTKLNESVLRQRELKQKYNDLLVRCNKASEYLDNKDISQEQKEKYIPHFQTIMQEMNSILQQVGAYTENEVLQGFTIGDIKAIEVNIDSDIENQLKELTDDYWQVKRLNYYKQSKKCIVILERPIFYQYASIINE